MCINTGVSLSVPTPEVVTTTNRTGPLYAGTSLTLTCTMTLHPNVDSDVSVSMIWSGPSTSDRYSLTNLHMSGRKYTRNLTISPSAISDSGRYQCTVLITRSSSETFNRAINYSAISIVIVCK